MENVTKPMNFTKFTAIDKSQTITYETESEFLMEFGRNKVTVPDTITDNGTDIDNGLLDQAIFGPIKDYTCKCGKLTGMMYDNMTCKTCKVTVTKRSVRNKIWGYFDLNYPILNPLFEEILVTKLLRLKKTDTAMIYDSNKIFLTFIDNGPLMVNINGEAKSCKISFNTGHHEMGYGPQAIHDIVSIMDRNYKISNFFQSRPQLLQFLFEQPVFNILKLLPAAYRDINTVGSMKIVDSINIAYKSIMSSAYRIEHYIKNNPEGYMLNAKFWYEVNRMRDEIIVLNTGSRNIKFKNVPIKNYSKILNKKSGLIRSRLLGKRCTHSARSVNTAVDPSKIDLSLDEMIIPFEMAKNLFRIHILKILNREYGMNYELATQHIDHESEILDEVISTYISGNYYIATSRAPALHNLSLMGMRAKVNMEDKSDKSIKIHPLENVPFNLDHDGDTMFIILPITTQGQADLRHKASHRSNRFYNKDGSPTYAYSLEYVYGLYYLTNPELGNEITDTWDAVNNYYCDWFTTDKGKKITYGSLMIKELFDKYNLSEYYDLGSLLDKKSSRSVIEKLLKSSDDIHQVLKLLTELTVLSAKGFTESGLSIKFSDFISIDKSRLAKTKNPVDYSHEESKLINLLLEEAAPDNAFISMMKSGAKGDPTQIKQVMISKGVLVGNDGEYLKPILNSLREGLDIDQFLTTIYASRRGMVSKSLSTAKTGYLYYRIVKSMRDIVITETDCGSSDGILMKVSDAEGRVLAESVKLIDKNTLLINGAYDELKSSVKLDSMVKVRSPNYCKSVNGVCSHCYGVNIGRHNLAQIGDNIGVITGSTLSEVLSQAMLKNFHTAGSTDMDKVVIKAPSDIQSISVEDIGEMKKVTIGEKTYVIHESNLAVHKTDNIKTGEAIISYGISNNDINKQFSKFEKIVECKKPDNKSILATMDGTLELVEIVDSVEMVFDKSLGLEIPRRAKKIKYRITNDRGESTRLASLPFDKTLLVPFGEKVSKGQPLTVGDIDYRSAVKDKLLSYDELVSYLLTDFRKIYHSQGVNIKSVHLETLIYHLIDRVGDKFTISGATNKGLERSFIQHMSLGWIKKAMVDVLDPLNQIGVTNADRVVLGNYGQAEV